MQRNAVSKNQKEKKKEKKMLGHSSSIGNKTRNGFSLGNMGGFGANRIPFGGCLEELPE